MSTTTLRIGTRGSELATTQAGHVRDALIAAGYPAELVIIKTIGDQDRVSPVERLGVGVFTQALRDAMAEDRCDIAVHSFKDLPTVKAEGFTVVAVPPRVNPRDLLVSKNGSALQDLPEGAIVGTSAPRRVSQLRAQRPDLDIRPLRGNIDTRISKVTDGELDAVLLAHAGLERTGKLGASAETLDTDVMLPAPAQGALAVECRSADTDIVAALRTLDDPKSHYRAIAERTILAELQAGCTAPVAGYSEFGADGTDQADELTLTGGVFAMDGSRKLLETQSRPVRNADEARALGQSVAKQLLSGGAHDIMGDTLR